VYTSKEYSNSLAGDPFPGSSNVTQLTDSMRLPNFRFYEDDDTHVGITLQNIQEDATTGIVTFDFLKNEATNGIRTIRQSGLLPSDNYYNLNGQRISAPSAKGRTIRIIKGRKVVL
jgi:immune inhibitor A